VLEVGIGIPRRFNHTAFVPQKTVVADSHSHFGLNLVRLALEGGIQWLIKVAIGEMDTGFGSCGRFRFTSPWL